MAGDSRFSRVVPVAPPVLERSFISDPDDLYSYNGILTSIETMLHQTTSSDVVLESFTIGKKHIDKLEFATGGPTTASFHCSSVVVAYAYAWLCHSEVEITPIAKTNAMVVAESKEEEGDMEIRFPLSHTSSSFLSFLQRSQHHSQSRQATRVCFALPHSDRQKNEKVSKVEEISVSSSSGSLPTSKDVILNLVVSFPSSTSAMAEEGKIAPSDPHLKMPNAYDFGSQKS
ncbi:hypothetical protein ZIOFF_026844 [Zingiber officinale]|uniref:Uncharacterized protein n=1 Tax=Zingiber officinale TaxID=94328 RepID=A0A8J5GY09_ZINOF|nr:hypothetical protein ZIOFF_026844 [Zingiber officinale]